MKRLLSGFLATTLLLLLCAAAQAHMLWLNPMDYYPAVGSTVDIGIGWGHTYPAERTDQEVKADRVEAIAAIDPDGRKVPLVQAAVDRYQLKIEKAGAYVVTARIKPGFFTMTPEGRKWGDKKAIANAVKCTNFHIEAKAVLIAGGDARNLDAGSDQALTLVPVTDPSAVKAGGTFAATVLYNNQPLADAPVKAAYAGFEPKKDEGQKTSNKGHSHSGGHYPVETRTDGQGRVEISVDRPGYWLLILSHKPDYPEKEVCDEYMYNVTYTLEVR